MKNTGNYNFRVKIPDAGALARFFGPRAFWPAAGLTAGAAVWLAAGRAVYPVQNFALYAERGELIFHAMLDKSASYSMPFFSLLASLAGYHGFGGMELIVKAALLGVYALAYALGAAGGLRWRGLAFVFPLVAMDLAGAGMEAEQIVYTFLIMLYLNLECQRLLRPGPAASVVSGLGLGMTLLVRSPLFAFAPIAALWEFAGGETLKKKLLRAALFLAAAYILLLPWIGFNRALFGRFIPFEQERGSCNIITAVKGSVFTMEGDCRALAGLSRTAGVSAWAAKELAARPLDYAASVFKRLWQVFLMFPVLIPLAVMGLASAWKKENKLIASLAGYFMLIHCLLSIEERYFYPLRYLLALPAAAGIFELCSRRSAQNGRGAGAWLYALFSGLMLPALAAEYRLLAYPARAANPLIAADRELARYPGDPWLLKKKGFLMLGFNRTEEGLGLLEHANVSSCGKESGLDYITRTVRSAWPPDWPPPGDGMHELELVKLLKELDMGRLDAAAVTLDRTKSYWAAEKNRLKGVPYERDREVLAEIRRTTFTAADNDLYRAMYFWPVEKRARIIDNLQRLTAITPKLEFLRKESSAAICAARPPEFPCEGAASQPGGGALTAVDENASSPGADLNYNATARDLTKAVLSKIGPLSGGDLSAEVLTRSSLPYPLPLILAAAYTVLRNKEPSGLARLSDLSRNADYRELGALIDLYENAPDRAAFKDASQRLLTLRPGELSPLVIRLSSVSRRGEDGAEALAALKKNPRPAVEAADLAADQGRAQDALRLLDWALGRTASGAETVQAAALLYTRLGAYERALAVLDGAIKKRPEDAGLYNDRGVTLRFLKRNKQAGEDFIRAYSLAPGSVNAAMNLAGIYAAAGETGKAAESYKKILAMPGLSEETARQINLELSRIHRAARK